MPKMMNLNALSDATLLRRLSEILRQFRRDEADLIAHIAEVDARGAFAREAVSSMFAYCVEVLHLSEPEAGLRIHVARTCRKHPGLLEMLRDGRIHLSGIALLAPVLTSRNRDTLLKRATHQPKSRIEEIVAELKPRPRAPVVVRRLPHHPCLALAQGPGAAGFSPLEHRPDDVADLALAQNPITETPPASEHLPDDVARSTPASSLPSGTEHRPDDGQRPHFPLSAPASRMEPVAPRSFRVHFTASAELRDKLERLQALMRSSVPDGDLARIIDQAVTEKLARLEAKRFGKTRKPRKSLSGTDTRPKSRHIPAAVRRAVEKRDGGRCTFRNEKGRRCSKRHDLEFHHREPYGFGGDHSPDNLALMCRVHNNLLAERDYGEEVMWRHRRHSARPSRFRTPSGPVSRKRGHG